MTRQPLTEALRRLLNRRIPDGRMLGDVLVEMVVTKAPAGDIRFIRLIFDRIELPMARQAVDRVPAACPVGAPVQSQGASRRAVSLATGVACGPVAGPERVPAGGSD